MSETPTAHDAVARLVGGFGSARKTYRPVCRTEGCGWKGSNTTSRVQADKRAQEHIDETTPVYGVYKAETSADGRRFEITKIGTTDRHPMNWSYIGGETSREGAWEAARQQVLPVVYCDASTGADTNELMELGEVFDPAAFERAAYSGYVAYGYSMSDGYYAPIQFESWVKSFRAEVLANAESIIHLYTEVTPGLAYADKIWTGNDLSDSVRASLPTYAARLQATTR